MSESDVISGLGSRLSIIHAVADAQTRGLNREELTLCSCAGAGTRVGDVIERSGLPEAKAIALLLGLRLRGIIHPGPARESRLPDSWKSAAGAPAPRPRPVTPPPARPTPTPPRPTPRPAAGPAAAVATARPSAPATAKGVDLSALSEDVELDDARKREILELEARLESANYFQLLGLAPSADPAAVKKAYYELTKRFHPDRYFGKNLGSFKGRIERIFKRLTEAQNVLSDPAKRKAYLAERPELAPAPAVRRDDPRAAERRARLARHPYLAKRAKFHELLAHGKELLAKGDFSKALTDLNLATQIDPKDAEAARLLSEAKKGGDRGRAEVEYNEAISSETLGDRARALMQLRKAVQLDPENAKYCHHLARMLMQFDSVEAIKEAHAQARRAAELAPDNAEFHATFASILLRAGLEKNAIREYEQVVRLRPDDAIAKDQLRKLKLKARIIS